MPKTAQGSLLSVALLSALVGLAGCHISFSSGSGSQSPSSAPRAKPAKKSPSKAAPSSSRTSKPIDSKPSSKPAEEPAKTTNDPERTKPAEPTDPQRKKTSDPQRKKTSDPQRTDPADAPAPTRNHIGRGRGDGGTDDGGTSRPGSVTTTKTDGGASERTRPTTVTAPR